MRTYHRSSFYEDGECLRGVEHLLHIRWEFREWFGLSRRIETVPGEFYEPPEAPETKPKRRMDRNAGYSR